MPFGQGEDDFRLALWTCSGAPLSIDRVIGCSINAGVWYDLSQSGAWYGKGGEDVFYFLHDACVTGKHGHEMIL